MPCGVALARRPMGHSQNEKEKAAVSTRGPDMLTDTWSLKEGIVSLQYPAKLSPLSQRLLQGWFTIQLEKIKQFGEADEPAKPSESVLLPQTEK